MSSKKVSGTIRMPDTIDSWKRAIHINVRNGKATMVYRWTDRNSDSKHTQRMTLDDAQAGKLLGILSRAAEAACGDEVERKRAVFNSLELEV